MNTFRLKITDCERLVYEGEATYCSVFTKAGSEGFEARHENALMVLRSPSALRFMDEKEAETTLEIETGLLSFFDNACSIMVETRREQEEEPD